MDLNIGTHRLLRQGRLSGAFKAMPPEPYHLVVYVCPRQNLSFMSAVDHTLIFSVGFNLGSQKKLSTESRSNATSLDITVSFVHRQQYGKRLVA